MKRRTSYLASILLRQGLHVLVAAATLYCAHRPGTAQSESLNKSFAGRPLFPPDNWWNLDIRNASVDPQSDAVIAWISGRNTDPAAVRRLHPDFGPPPYGIPYSVVRASQPRIQVPFVRYPAESDAGASGEEPGYPILDEARSDPGYVEGGVAGGGSDGDRHLLIVDEEKWLLFELFGTSWNSQRSRWEAESGAAFNLASNERRPEGWTSADAAGLAILPGLVKYDECQRPDEIRHAFRVTTRGTNGYVWPASHRAGSTMGAPPLGARLRLKSSVRIDQHPAYIQRMFRAMQAYGLIVADNGSDMFVSGTMDARWNTDELNGAFRELAADDFELVTLGWGQELTVLSDTAR